MLEKFLTALADDRLEVAAEHDECLMWENSAHEAERQRDDARLELQEAKDSRDGFACDLDHAESEVARLTEERRRLALQVEAIAFNGASVWHFAVRQHYEAAHLSWKVGKQREDIRRLVNAAEGVRAMPGAGRDLLALLADLSAQYPKGAE